MRVDVIEVDFKPTMKRLGWVLLRYENLFMQCDLVCYRKEKKLWIRMPEVWLTPENKKRFCWWPSKQMSDMFQNLVLEKIYFKYKISRDEIIAAMETALSKKPKKPT